MAEKKNKCEKCGALISPEYTMCSVCNAKYNNEIIIIDKFGYDLTKTVDLYKVKVIELFYHHDTIVLSFIGRYEHIADKLIREIRHMGIQQDKRYIKKEKSKKTSMEIEYIKAPLTLIPAIGYWKNDIKKKVLRDDD